MDPDHPLDQRPDPARPQRPVGDRRGRDPERARRGRSGRAASRGTAAAGPAWSSARARLFISAIFTSAGQAVVHVPQPEHQSTVASGDSSDATPGPAGGEERREPEALGLRPDVLRAREEVGDPGDRADGVADVALQAFVGRQRRPRTTLASSTRSWIVIGPRPGARLASACGRGRRTSDAPSIAAARRPLAIATPSPHRSVR